MWINSKYIVFIKWVEVRSRYHPDKEDAGKWWTQSRRSCSQGSCRTQVWEEDFEVESTQSSMLEMVPFFSSVRLCFSYQPRMESDRCPVEALSFQSAKSSLPLQRDRIICLLVSKYYWALCLVPSNVLGAGGWVRMACIKPNSCSVREASSVHICACLWVLLCQIELTFWYYWTVLVILYELGGLDSGRKAGGVVGSCWPSSLGHP